jgi:hypothetical protein
MATTPDLYQQIFNSGDIWNVSSQLTKVNSDTMFVLFKAGLLIGFGAACIQLFSALFHVYRNKNANLMDFIAPLILKIILVGIFLTPVVYQAFVVAVFAAPADAAANLVTQIYINHFTADFQQVFATISNSPNKISSLISATLDGSLISTLLAGLIFWAAAICAYVMPIIQGILFLFVYYVGPICMGFALCDYTASVFRSWISLMLTICWLGFFGSCSFLVVDSCQLLSKLSVSAGGDSPNVILTMIYGIVSILLFCASFPIASYFFGSIAEMTGLTHPGRAITSATSGAMLAAGSGGVGTMMLGGLGGIAGAGLAKISKEGSWGSKLGASMQNIGKNAMSTGAAVAENSGVRMPRNHPGTVSNAPDGKSGSSSPNIPTSKK